ncbi:MAG: hypothetical protein ACRDPY_11370 [Streptosporangiaceae bacterium]
MARSAKFSASAFVRAENRPPGSRSSGEFPSQMYSEAASRGPAGGHKNRSPGGGLITAQSANDIVRDQRNTPSLLVSVNWCSCRSNHPAYPATGIAPAITAATKAVTPTRRTSSATSSTASSTSPTGHNIAETPSAKAAPAVKAGRRSPGDRSSRYRAIRTMRQNEMSGTVSVSSCSS